MLFRNSRSFFSTTYAIHKITQGQTFVYKTNLCTCCANRLRNLSGGNQQEGGVAMLWFCHRWDLESAVAANLTAERTEGRAPGRSLKAMDPGTMWRVKLGLNAPSTCNKKSFLNIYFLNIYRVFQKIYTLCIHLCRHFLHFFRV